MGEKWLYNAPIVVFPPSHFSGGKLTMGENGSITPDMEQYILWNFVLTYILLFYALFIGVIALLIQVGFCNVSTN